MLVSMDLVSSKRVVDHQNEHRTDPVGRGILLRFALSIILEEIDNEANALMDTGSPFRGAGTWSWDSLLQLSLDSQQAYAMKNAPVLWSILSTVAVNKGRRTTMEIKEEGRDPWQVCIVSTVPEPKPKLQTGDCHCALYPTLFPE